MSKKTLSHLLILILIVSLIIAGYFIDSIMLKNDKQIIKLTEKSRIGKTVVWSKLKTPYKLVMTLKGSINDTIIFDGRKIFQTDIDEKIHDYDWYADSAWFYFDAYKATKVDMKVTFIFYQ